MIYYFAIWALLWSGNMIVLSSSRRTARGLVSSMSSSISSSVSGSCSSELLECSNDETCLACISSGHINTAECNSLYPTRDDSESTYCHMIASAYCCAAYQMTEQPISCVESELVIDYWTCTLDANGCTQDDLPCFGDDAFIPTTANITSSSDNSSMTSQEDTDGVLSESSGAMRTQTLAALLVAALACVVGFFRIYLAAYYY